MLTAAGRGGNAQKEYSFAYNAVSMTLILTVARRDLAVQVSDRRFVDVDPSGRIIRVETDDGNKALSVRCPDGVFSVAFAGMAAVGGASTADWLTYTFSNGRAPARGVKACFELAKSEGTLVIRDAAKHWPEMPPLAFVFAGFMSKGQRPFITVVSNIESAGFPLPKPQPDMQIYTGRQGVKITGMPALVPRRTRKRILAAMRLGRDASALQDMLVEELRRAAGKSGEGVGSNCVSVATNPSGGTTALYYDGRGSSQIFAPNRIDTYSAQGGEVGQAVISEVRGYASGSRWWTSLAGMDVQRED